MTGPVGPVECSQVYQPLVNLRALERPGWSHDAHATIFHKNQPFLTPH